MGLQWHARVRVGGPAGTAILASAALAASMTVLAGAGTSAAAARPGEASRALTAGASAARAAGAAAPDGTISTVAGGVGGPAAGTSVNLGVSTPVAGTASSPCGVSFGQGQLLVADNWTVRSIDPASGRLTTPLGTAASGPFRDGSQAASTSMDTCAVAVDAAGNLVITDAANDRLRVVPAATGTFYGQQMTAGNIYTIAGTGTYGSSGDGGPATSAQLSDPASVAVDAAGNLVITSNSASRVQVIADQDGSYYGQPMTGGDIYTIAGDGTAGYTGDGGPATSARLDGPQGMTVDAAGNLVIADTGNSVIRVIAGHDGTFYGQQMTTGDIYTIAGTGTAGYAGDGGPATSALVSVPAGVAADTAGNLLIADSGNSVVRVIADQDGSYYGQPMTGGDIYTIAGTGTGGFTGEGNLAARAELNAPQGLTVDGSGNVVIADTGNYRVRVVAAGTGTFYGKQMTAGHIYTVAGGSPSGLAGDGGPATATRLSLPYGATVDAAGNLVIADTGNNRIRVIAAASGSFYGQPMTTGDIYTVAGTGIRGFSGDGHPATAAKLNGAAGVAVDAAGNLVLADTGNNRIRIVAGVTGTFYGQQMTAGNIYTIAGTGTAGYTGDGGPADSARLSAPVSVTMDADGNLVIADSANNVIRVVAGHDGTCYGQQMTGGNIYTIAGTGTAGYTGDGGPATSATLYYPQGVTADSTGSLVIADTGNNVIRVVAGHDGTFYGEQMTGGNIYTVAGTGAQGFSGDGGPATSAGLTVPASVTTDATGNLVIADYGDNRVRVVAASDGSYYGQPMTGGDIYTIAGSGAPGFSGDGGPATSATLHYPQGVTADSTGDVLVTDSGDNRVRMITGSNPATRTGLPAAAAGRPGSRAHTAGRPARRHAARAGDPATAGPYVTLLFSRTETSAADNCVPDNSGIAPLDTVVAPYLRSLGMTGTGTLVTGMTQATVPTCTHSGDSLTSSWADAANLASNFGWSFVSHTATYPSQLGRLAPTQSYAETCGSVAVLDGQGLPGGHGLIAYPGIQTPPVALQAGYGANCFAWGRAYNKSGTTPAANGTTPPYWQETEAVNGGACHVQTAPCYKVSSGANGHLRYDEPSTIIAKIQALQPGQWFTLQVYVLVTGTNPGYSHNATRWDCTSPDPALHWTNDNERYCYSDWQQIVSAIAAMPNVTVTDPLTVGVAFGRPASYP
jgi:hypothetical protein